MNNILLMMNNNENLYVNHNGIITKKMKYFEVNCTVLQDTEDSLMRRVGEFFTWLNYSYNNKQLNFGIRNFLSTEYVIDTFLAFKNLINISIVISIVAGGNIKISINNNSLSRLTVLNTVYGSIEIMKNKIVYTTFSYNDYNLEINQYQPGVTFRNDFYFQTGNKPIIRDLVIELLRKSDYDVLSLLIEDTKNDNYTHSIL